MGILANKSSEHPLPDTEFTPPVPEEHPGSCVMHLTVAVVLDSAAKVL